MPIEESIERPDLRQYLARVARKYEVDGSGEMIQDGYDWMGANSGAWNSVAGWGRDGWDMGDWPYVVIQTMSVKVDGVGRVWGVSTYVEGDIDIRAYASAEDCIAALDEVAAFYWRLNSEDHPDVPPIGPLTEARCGQFSWKRLDRT